MFLLHRTFFFRTPKSFFAENDTFMIKKLDFLPIKIFLQNSKNVFIFQKTFMNFQNFSTTNNLIINGVYILQSSIKQLIH